MAILKPFKGFRPVANKAKAVASRPYDVLDSDEAREEVKGNPDSFLYVVKPEIDLPEDIDHYAPEVYQKAKDNFEKLVASGAFFQDKTDCLYIYRQEMDNQYQTGIVGCAAVEDYLNDIIKKHELTRPDKEEDRKNHVRVANMNAEPVFFAYPAVAEIDAIVEEVKQGEPVYDFLADEGFGHTFWVLDDPEKIARIVDLFAKKVPFTYVADGHHRTAAAALVGAERKADNPAHKGDEEYNFFLAVHFPDNQLRIIDYNRVVKDLNGLSSADFLAKLAERFTVQAQGAGTYKPDRLHNFSMYLDGQWYSLTAKAGTYDDSDPIGVLDVTILSAQVLAPLPGITDLRRDKRIDFVGGIRGLGELKRRVDSGEMRAAFALYPVSMQQLIDIADTGNIMPPKTTWFEPKLRSGLVVHMLD